MLTSAQRTARHRKKKYLEISLMPKIPCSCGCGTLIAPITTAFVPARFVRGHQWRDKRRTPHTSWAKGLGLDDPRIAKIAKKNRGKKRISDSINKMVAKRKQDGSYVAWNKGIPMRKESKEKLSRIMIERGTSAGANNPAWEGGKSLLPYPPDFTPKLRQEIKKRDNFTCQYCGKQRCKLNVHHIDTDKNNCKLSNLITLCVPCHIKTHWQIKKQIRNS